MARASLCTTLSRSTYNVWMVSLAFMSLFCAYNTLQGYVTTLFPSGLGNQSLAVLYGSVAIFVFFGTPLTQVLGARLAMFVGALCYVVYIASLIRVVAAVVLVMSCVIGFGAAVLWVALGVWITENSTPLNRGHNMGVFWSIFQLSNLLGPLVTYFVFPHLSSDSVLFAGFTVCGALGVALLLLLRPVDGTSGGAIADESAAAAPLLPGGSTRSASVNGAKGTRAGSSDGAAAALAAALAATQEAAKVALRQRLRASSCMGRVSWVAASFAASTTACARMLGTRDMALLVPLIFFSGCELSFWSAAFPLLVPPRQVGLILAFVGVGEVLGGITMGKLGDAVSRSAPALVGGAAYALALGLSCWMQAAGGVVPPMIVGVPLVAFIAAICFGLADSAFNTTCYSMVSQLYGDPASEAPASVQRETGGGSPRGLPTSESTTLVGAAAASTPEATPLMVDEGDASSVAFTILQLVQNIGSAIWFVVCLKLPLTGNAATDTPGSYTQVYVQAVLLLCGLACFALLDGIARARRHPLHTASAPVTQAT